MGLSKYRTPITVPNTQTKPKVNMQVLAILATIFAAVSASYIAPASHIARVPSHDSAVIQSHRLGGNFAYRTDEAHAYASVHPVITPVQVPVAETYHAPVAYRTPVTYETKHHVETYQAPVHSYAAPVHTYAAPAYHGYAAPAHHTYAALGHHAYAAPHHAYAAPHHAYAGYTPLAYVHAGAEEKAEE